MTASTRFYASPTAFPTPADGVAWMDRTTDDGCPTYSMANLLTRGSIGSGQTLSLHKAKGQPCDQARFASLSMMVWRNASVTAEALVSRFSDKLGSPVVTRAFDRDEIAYRWRTRYGTTVELTEGLAGDWRHWLRLVTSKRDK